MSEKTSDPTPAMIDRCKAWIQVVDTLETYLKAAAQRYDWISEATGRLSREMPQPDDLGDQFAPVGSGGIKDLFSRLWWDLNLPDGKCADDASATIKNKLLGEVAALRADLKKSIADFEEHSASFGSANDLAPSKTAQLNEPKLESRINKYVNAVSEAEAGKQPEMDPFLIKLALDTKIGSAVRKHNRQADSYAYVQDAAKRVDGAVVERLQALLAQYTAIVEHNGKIIANGGHTVSGVFVRQPKLAEYKYWLQSKNAPQTLKGQTAQTAKSREVDTDLGYPKEDSPWAKALRTGQLERRTRILKTYSASDYVLTPLSLIELRQNEPVWSIDLLDASLNEEHKANSNDQFVIRARQHGSSSGSKHNWVFRAQVAANWRRDLKALFSGSMPQNLSNMYPLKSNKSKDAFADAPGMITGAPTKQVQNMDPFEKKEAVVAPGGVLGTAVPASAPVTASPLVQQQPTAAATQQTPTAATQQPPSQSFSEQSFRQPAATTGATTAATTVPASHVAFSQSTKATSAPTPPALSRGVSGASVKSNQAAVGIATAQPSTREFPAGAEPVTATSAAAAPGTFGAGTTLPATPGPAAPGPVTPVAVDPQVVRSLPPQGATVQAASSTASSTIPVERAHAPLVVEGVESDSEVSDVEDSGYQTLSEEEKETLAWQAERDMEVFNRPMGAEGAEAIRADERQQRAAAGLGSAGSAGSAGVGSVPTSGPTSGSYAPTDTWEYDQRNRDGLNTLQRDPHFRPAEADVPVERERRLSETHHKSELPAGLSPLTGAPGEKPLPRRGSRKATGSFGEHDAPLAGLTPDQRREALGGDPFEG